MSFPKAIREKPAGYFARYEVKQRYEQRRREEQRFSQIVEAELEQMGLDPERDIPTDDQIERAEAAARERME